MNEKTIWDFLLAKTNNAYGTAAIMGNLVAESSLSPMCATGLSKTGYSSVNQYIIASDDGVHDFANDEVAFGLAQWRYWSRKQGLLEYAKSKNKSVGDLTTQLEYLWQEMQSYKTVLLAVKDAKAVREASDIFMLRYEKPGNTGEAAKRKRSDYGEKFYNEYAGEKKKYVVSKVRVNVRTGNSTSSSKFGLLMPGSRVEWVATSENNWHAIKLYDKIGWVSGEFVSLE